MRLRPATIALALWGFGLNLALQKGWLAAVPDWVVGLMLVVPICIWAFIGLTHNRFKNYLHRTNRHVAMLVFVVVGAVLGGATGGVVYALSQRSAKDDGGKQDLEVSILNFGYDQITQELVSDVEFRNNGSGRRTVVRVNFVYNKPEFGSSEVFHRETRRLLPSNEPTRPSDPVYVDPNLPVVITYRHPIAKEVVNWPDSIFGLEITTVGKDGLRAITKIDVMYVPDVPNRGYSIWGLKRFSLDLPQEKRKSPLK